MAYFAQLDSNNVVQQVISINNDILLENGIELEIKGINFCKSLFGQDTNWKKTSFNTIEGKYYDLVNGIHVLSENQNKSFRINFAGKGMIYDEVLNGFIEQKPYLSWILNQETGVYSAPIPKPEQVLGQKWMWSEDNNNWIAVNL